MRKYLFLFCLLPVLAAAANNEEFRATWVITWEHSSAGRGVEASKAKIREILDRHKAANMNAVLWQVRQGGTAYYRSGYEPWGPYVGYQYPGFDPLAYAIEQAHARGMELHAWFNTFHCSETIPGAPAGEHPEWVCRNASGQPMTSSRALSPGLAAVRAYTVRVAMDIVEKYDIDGLHLDYVRWNEESGATSLSKESREQPLDGHISTEKLAALNSSMASRYLYDVEHPYSAGVPAGYATWPDFWRDSVTGFVRTLHDSIQAAKPWVRLSAAALGKYNWSDWQGYGTVYQDVALWFNEGYVDQLTPMHYHWTTGASFYSMLVGPGSSCWGPYIQKGIADGRLFSVGPGSYILSENKIFANHAAIVDYCRMVPWVDGFQFFSYGSWETNRYFPVAGETFFKDKTKIRPAKFLHDGAPETPGLTLTPIDSFTYQITVIPPTGQTGAHRLVLYRSEDDAADTGSDTILDIVFTDSTLTYVDRFTGTQNHEGAFHYFATQVDRFWNESAPSASAASDFVTSLPPRVVAATPQEGDTVRVDIRAEITFSKSMDPATVASALVIAPALAVKQLTWSSDNRQLVILFAQKLSFSTAYTLEITPDAKDVNGKALDGDGDGVAGDPFVLHFVSEAQDVHGPRLLATFPFAGAEELLAVEGVINLTFDEPLLPASVPDSSVKLRKNGELIPVNRTITTLLGQGVISIQPKAPFDLNSDYTLELAATVSDTAGNVISEPLALTFKTAGQRNESVKSIDAFNSVTAWKAPSYSGSTVGIYAPNTVFEVSKTFYLPNSLPLMRSSACLRYEWDESKTEFLLREYLDPAAAPSLVYFDTTYTLQCYIFGDGSGNQFRFCLNDSTRDQAAFHEVSQWITIDWIGWRLVEWRLNDPESVGSWLGDRVLHGSKLNIDSFHLTHPAGSASKGALYFDNLQVVKKTSFPVGVDTKPPQLPQQFALLQNYPNPFNPVTQIDFVLPHAGHAKVEVFDVLGREVACLVDERKEAGLHHVLFDGRTVAAGTYFYRLAFEGQMMVRKMSMVK